MYASCTRTSHVSYLVSRSDEQLNPKNGGETPPNAYCSKYVDLPMGRGADPLPWWNRARLLPFFVLFFDQSKTDWDAAKKVLGDSNFMDKLKNYDKVGMKQRARDSS